jgi:hypothetical protein
MPVYRPSTDEMVAILALVRALHSLADALDTSAALAEAQDRAEEAAWFRERAETRRNEADVVLTDMAARRAAGRDG